MSGVIRPTLVQHSILAHAVRLAWIAWAQVRRLFRRPMESAPSMRRGFGLVLGRRIYATLTWSRVEAAFLRHEIMHICQMETLGVWGFLKSYFWDQRAIPYARKWQEVEARLAESDGGYRKVAYPDLEFGRLRRRWFL